MKEYITIKENAETKIIEKKSKFIANLFYVENISQAESKIKEIRKKYFDAKHHCFAYRILENEMIIEKSSDDGEPSGTAGQPMLSILKNNNLVNVIIIVTRYFGGILLGTGGLVKAYSESLLEAIKETTKIKKVKGYELEVSLEYADFENFKYYCKNKDINIKDVKYIEYIVCKIELEADAKSILIEDFESKKIKLKDIKELSIKYISKSI